MVAWADYRNAAQERGSLALELYVVISSAAGSGEDVKVNLPAHLAYQAEKERERVLAFAGPLSDLTGESMEGTGLIVYRAASLDEARSIAEQDPMHKNGARDFTIRRWLINEGSFSITVGLSTGAVKLE